MHCVWNIMVWEPGACVCVCVWCVWCVCVCVWVVGCVWCVCVCGWWGVGGVCVCVCVCVSGACVWCVVHAYMWNYLCDMQMVT